jgi:ADP-heptose:LPS heptosyltransferase
MVKFLVVRFSSIGDIILTTPLVRCLRNQVEEAEIHYLTKLKFASIVKENPNIDKVHVLNKNMKQLLSELKAENFDYVIDLHRNIRTFIVKLTLSRMSFSVNKLNVKKWLIVNFKWNLLPQKHIVDRYLETLKLFSVTNDEKGLDFFISNSEKLELSTILQHKTLKLVVVVIGGGHYTKQIPGDKIAELIQNLNCNVALIGGTEDINKTNEILLKINKKNVYNFVGKLSLGQSASLISQSDCIVTPDTGMMHIAAAFRKTIFSLWGNTVPEFGMYPYKPDDRSKIFEIKNLPCRPCSKIGFSECPKKHFRCMEDQDISNISNTINKILDLNE